MVLIKANTKRRKRIGKSYIPLDAGNPELCSIKMGLRSTYSTPCGPVRGKRYPILVIQAIIALSNKKTTLFIIPTVRQKGCSQENLLDKGKARRVA